MSEDADKLADRVLALECAFSCLVRALAERDAYIPADVARILSHNLADMREQGMSNAADALGRLQGTAANASAAAIRFPAPSR
jgi:hypothetical protein